MTPAVKSGCRKSLLLWCAAFWMCLSPFEACAAAASSPLDFELDPASTVEKKADNLRMTKGGYLESRNQYGLHSGTLLSARQLLFLETQISVPSFSLYLSGEAECDPAIRSWDGPNTNVWLVGPKEFYAAFDSPAVDVYLGQRIITWGTGDGINPLDLFNPDDTRDPAADVRTRSKRPVPMLHVVWKPSPVMVEAVVLPWAQVNRSQPENSPWTPAYIRQFRDMDRAGVLDLHEDDSPTGAEGGLRVSATLGKWDVAFIYFNGLQDHPVFSLDTTTGLPRYIEEHPRMQALGVTFATEFYGGTVRGEAAWKPDFTVAGKDSRLMKADYFETVFGIDRTFAKNFYVNVQYFTGVLTEKPGRSAGPPIVQGVTASVSDLFLDDTLEAGIKGVGYFEGDQGVSVQPYVSYSFDDRLKATLAYSAWDGPAAGRLGQYSDNDMLTFTLRYSF